MKSAPSGARAQRAVVPVSGRPNYLPAARKSKEDRHFVTALARGLDVLACFRIGESTLSNQELAQRCELPKSTVSRLTMTLTKAWLPHLCARQRPLSAGYRLPDSGQRDANSIGRAQDCSADDARAR